MIWTTLLISLGLIGAQPSTTHSAPAPSETTTESSASTSIDTPEALLDELARRDANIQTMRGDVRYTIIKILESDLQQRFGDLYIRRVETNTESGTRHEYAVNFETLVLDRRAEQVREHYIFDGRWFVERRYDERQFIKREIVPKGETLDPMELMSEAPYWVSLGESADRVLESYDLALEAPTDWLVSNSDYEQLTHLAPLVTDHHHLLMRPKQGSSREDDWESVRIWFDRETLLPRLYIKTEWSGDLQIVELFGVQTNEALDPKIFDTRTPPPESGWRVQISPWRGDAP